MNAVYYAVIDTPFVLYLLVELYMKQIYIHTRARTCTQTHVHRIFLLLLLILGTRSGFSEILGDSLTFFDTPADLMAILSELFAAFHDSWERLGISRHLFKNRCSRILKDGLRFIVRDSQ